MIIFVSEMDVKHARVSHVLNTRENKNMKKPSTSLIP